MPITVVTSNSDGIIHGTDNGKKTGCGIKYNTGDNLRKYKQGEVLTDLIMAMKTLNCEKCRRVLSSKMIKEDRKAENRREKEEQKRIAEAIKRGELDADGNPIEKPQEEVLDDTQTTTEPIAETTQFIQDTTVEHEHIEVQENINSPELAQNVPEPIQDEPIVSNEALSKENIVDDDISQFMYKAEEPLQTNQTIQDNEPITQDDDFSQFIVNPEQLKQPEEPKPVKKKPLTDINDILADLDAIMSNISVKASKPIEEPKVEKEDIPQTLEYTGNTPIQEFEIDDVSDIDNVAPNNDTQEEDIQEISYSNTETENDTQTSNPTLDDLTSNNDSMEIEEISYNIPQVQEVSSPILEDVSPIEDIQSVQEVILEDVSPIENIPQVQEVSSTILEDVSPIEDIQSVQEVSSPILEDVSPIEDIQPVQEVSSTILEDVSPIEDIQPVQEVSSTILEDVSPIEDIQPVQEVSSTILEDVSSIENIQPVQEVSSTILQDVSPIEDIQPVQEVSSPIKTISTPTIQPTPVAIPVQPTPQVPIPPTPMPQFYYNAYGEAIPITYNAQNQPIFTVPVTYDVQGQPRPVQTAPIPIPVPQPYISPNPYSVPQSTVYTQSPMPPPTRVVRADAPPLVSNPSSSKPFDFSIFEKENKAPVFTSSESKIFVDSIEEALNQLGVETEDKKEENEIMPEFQEYVAPSKDTAKIKSNEDKKSPTLSEAERKKREKMDAKLRKEWEKKGLDPNAWKRMKH